VRRIATLLFVGVVGLQIPGVDEAGVSRVPLAAHDEVGGDADEGGGAGDRGPDPPGPVPGTSRLGEEAAGDRGGAVGELAGNLALAEVEKAFSDEAHKPYKKSKKTGPDGEWIELAFVSPEVGARHQKIIDDLAYKTSWSIRIAPSVDQQAVLRIVKELIPASWQVSKGPGLDVAGRKVKLRFTLPPPPREVEVVVVTLAELTGFTIG
jgi:hypothetical protein